MAHQRRETFGLVSVGKPQDESRRPSHNDCFSGTFLVGYTSQRRKIYNDFLIFNIDCSQNTMQSSHLRC